MDATLRHVGQVHNEKNNQHSEVRQRMTDELGRMSRDTRQQAAPTASKTSTGRFSLAIDRAAERRSDHPWHGVGHVAGREDGGMEGVDKIKNDKKASSSVAGEKGSV